MEDGSVYGWGRNEEGQFPHHTEIRGHLMEPVELPGLPTGSIVQLGASGVYSAALTGEGSVLTWGSGKQGQLGRPDLVTTPATAGIVQDLPPCQDIACGWGHVVCLTTQGSVMSYGFGEWGQLGTGSMEKRLSPTRLGEEAFGGRRVVSVSTGLDHSLAITEDGEVWSWGYGGNGQLGHGDTDNQPYPKRVMGSLAGRDVVHVTGGWSHSAAVTRDGTLHVWGGDSDGQLGLAESNGGHGGSGSGGGGGSIVTTPTALMGGIESPSGLVITGVSLGRVHSACVTSEGSLYTWGMGHKGRLGHGGTENEPRPRRIELDEVIAEGAKAAAVACGLDHTVVVVVEGG